MLLKSQEFGKKNSELATKLNKHSERLASGKLPAKWHLPSRIEEDIGQERTKLGESQAELHKLVLQASHIQHSINHGSASEDERGSRYSEGEDSEGVLDVGNLSLGRG